MLFSRAYYNSQAAAYMLFSGAYYNSQAAAYIYAGIFSIFNHHCTYERDSRCRRQHSSPRSC